MKKFLMGAMLLCVVAMFTGCGMLNQLTTNVNIWCA